MTRTLVDGEFDTGIARAVEVLRSAGVETCASCEGGAGHPYPEPTVVFYGGQGEGFRALGVALTHGLPVQALDRVWRVIDGEPDGPLWQLRFWPEKVSAVFPEDACTPHKEACRPCRSGGSHPRCPGCAEWRREWRPWTACCTR